MEIVAQGKMQMLKRDFECRARFGFDEYQIDGSIEHRARGGS